MRVLYVDSPFLRERFNALDYYGRLLRGDLRAEIAKERPAPAAANQEPGTVTQRVRYLSEDRVVAIVHQYVRLDGTIGGSGRPDPKWVLDGDVILNTGVGARLISRSKEGRLNGPPL